MAVKQEVSDRIRDLLRDNPRGMNISSMVRAVGINRNTLGKYLDILLISGQVEMHRFGMAKIYTLSRRLPVFSVLSLSSEYVLHVDRNLRTIFLNTPFLDLLGLAEKDVTGKKLDYTSIPAFFEESYPRLLCWINEGLAGVKRRGELVLPAKGLFFSCRVFRGAERGFSHL
jgi:PAS domain-containing protein